MAFPITPVSILLSIGGDSASARWGEFAEIYVPVMRSYCAAVFPGLDADDVIQETLLALVKALPNYRYDPEAKGHFHSWLIGILRHKALAQLASRRKAAKAEETYCLSREADTQAPTDAELKQATLEIAIRELLADPAVADRSKQVFVQVALEHRRPIDVAEAFGITRNSVDQIRSRLTIKLRKIISNLDSADVPAR